MGLFGFSPEKKLAKAKTLLEEQRLFDALRAFRELIDKQDRLDSSQLGDVRSGYREVRERMIRERLEEAESLYRAEDLQAAKDRCMTAMDLAEEDIDPAPIREKIQQIESPKRHVPAQGGLSEAVPSDLLPPPDADSDRAEAKPKRPKRTPEEVFGDDPEGLFEVHMNTIHPDLAADFRSMDQDFRFGYLALCEGEGELALECFDRMSWEPLPILPVVLERARALLFTHRAEESLELLDRVAAEISHDSGSEGDSPPVGDAVRLPSLSWIWLRIEVLRELGRLEDALEGARLLVEVTPEPSPHADALLAWTLLEAGKPEEAHELLEGWVAGQPTEEVLVPAAQAAWVLGRQDEAMELLENLIQQSIEVSLLRGREPEFPVEAGRRLLQLYIDAEEPEDRVRPLLMHLLDYDPENGEEYRGHLLRL